MQATINTDHANLKDVLRAIVIFLHQQCEPKLGSLPSSLAWYCAYRLARLAGWITSTHFGRFATGTSPVCEPVTGSMGNHLINPPSKAERSGHYTHEWADGVDAMA
jgi:hypothetical protein